MTIDFIPPGERTKEHILEAVSQYKQPPKVSNRVEREQLVANIAEELLQRYHFVTTADNLQLLRYRDGVYVEGAEAFIHEYIRKRLRYELKNADRREVVEHIRYENIKERNEFDADIEIINLANGLLNINTAELTPHNPDYLSLSQIPRSFLPKYSCHYISRFLLDVLEKDKVGLVVRMLGYMLYRAVKYEKAFVLLGSGSNGKSILINVIKAFFGLENISSESLHSLVSDKFATAELYNKYVNLFADLKSDKLPETGPFKMLTSGDILSAQKKYGKRFQFTNFAKMVFSANEPPEAKDDYAYYRRLVILPFDKTFEGALKDTELLAKLTSEEQLSGMLNLMLIGWRLLRQDGGFEDESVVKIREEYQYRASNVKRFLDGMCEVNLANSDYVTKTERVYDAYKDYCNKEKQRSLELNTFGSKLSEFGILHKSKMIKRQRDYYYIGLKLKSDLAEGNQTLPG